MSVPTQAKGAASAAVVLLSGGLDSVTVLAIARAAGHDVHALSFRYGQRHAMELGCAARQAQRFGVVAHEVIDLRHLGRLVAPATALVEGSELSVPKGRDVDQAGDIPVTYVPARNTLFLSYALAWAEALDARDKSPRPLQCGGREELAELFVVELADQAGQGHPLAVCRVSRTSRAVCPGRRRRPPAPVCGSGRRIRT